MKKIVGLILGVVMIMMVSMPVYAYTDLEKYGRMSSCAMSAEETEAVEQFIKGFIEEHGIRDMCRVHQVIALKDYLCEEVKYDYDFKKDRRTAYSLVVNGLTVCSGYAQFTQMYFEELGVPCDIVKCTVDNSKNPNFLTGIIPHVMNMVQMEDGLWYYVDYTWNKDLIYDKDVLFGEETASKIYYTNRETRSYSDVSMNEVSKEDYFEKYERQEDEQVNLVRAFLKTLNEKGYIEYYERPYNLNDYIEHCDCPNSINNEYNGLGWVEKNGRKVFSFKFMYNEKNYDLLGCWYN